MPRSHRVTGFSAPTPSLAVALGSAIGARNHRTGAHSDYLPPGIWLRCPDRPSGSQARRQSGPSRRPQSEPTSYLAAWPGQLSARGDETPPAPARASPGTRPARTCASTAGAPVGLPGRRGRLDLDMTDPAMRGQEGIEAGLNRPGVPEAWLTRCGLPAAWWPVVLVLGTYVSWVPDRLLLTIGLWEDHRPASRPPSWWMGSARNTAKCGRWMA